MVFSRSFAYGIAAVIGVAMLVGVIAAGVTGDPEFLLKDTPLLFLKCSAIGLAISSLFGVIKALGSNRQEQERSRFAIAAFLAATVAFFSFWFNEPGMLAQALALLVPIVGTMFVAMIITQSYLPDAHTRKFWLVTLVPIMAGKTVWFLLFSRMNEQPLGSVMGATILLVSSLCLINSLTRTYELVENTPHHGVDFKA